MARYKSQILLLPILVLGLWLRLWGIGWGLPNDLHTFSYHTDETVLLIHSTTTLNSHGLNVFAGQFLPHFYNYGSLQLVLIDVVATIAAAYVPQAHTSDIIGTLTTVYLVGRLLTVLMGTVTLAAVWALGRRLYGDTVGLFAALLLAVAPLHAQHSHFMTVDVPATMWVVLSLLWSARVLTDSNVYRTIAISGVMAGFAAATKYNCAIAILPLIAAIVIRADQDAQVPVPKKIGRVALAVAAGTIAYLIGCPGTILDSHQFITDFLFEKNHVMSQQELWFQGTGNGWWYIYSRNLDAGFGLPLLLAATVGAGYAAYKRSPGDWLTAAFVIPYYFVIGAAVSRYARYEIPLLPILALWAARILIDGAKGLNTPVRFGSFAAIGIVTAITAWSAFLLIKPFSEVDPRDRAETWIGANTQPTDMIGVPTEPWFYTPPIDRFFTLPGDGQWEGTYGGVRTRARLVYAQDSPFDSATLIAGNPVIVALSEYEYYDRLRLHDKATSSYLAVLRAKYLPPIVFADNHPVGGRSEVGGLPCQDLPVDMNYASPTILIYRRR